MELEKYFKSGSVYVWNGTFAIVKARKIVPQAFANIVDRDEITVIVDQTQLDSVEIHEIERDWKVFTLDIVFPMNVYGVTATIARALADENISIMPIAAYSRDHFLIKAHDAERALRVFEGLGIQLSEAK